MRRHRFRRPLTFKRLAWTWLPTAFGASMLATEVPAVYAAVARSSDGPRALAALGVAFGILTLVNTSALALAPLVVTEAGRHPARRMWRYSLGVGVLGALVLLALGTLPVLVPVLELVVGRSDSGLVHAVQMALLGLVPNSLAVAIRRYLHGRLIYAERTKAIMLATGTRILGTAVMAWTLVFAFRGQGALVGGVALSIGAFVEAGMLARAVRALPRVPGERVVDQGGTLPERGGVRGLAREHWKLSTAQFLNIGPMLITTIGVAHSAEPRASLVAWPALYQLASLFFAPTGDWQSVAATALRERPAHPKPRQLTALLGAACVGIFALIVIGGGARFYLRSFVDVPAHPAELGLRWLPLLLPVPALWLIRGYLRGRAMSEESTRRLVWASGAHLLTLAAALAVASRTSLPGVAVGCVAILCGLVAEVAVTRILGRVQEPTAGAALGRAALSPGASTRPRPPA